MKKYIFASIFFVVLILGAGWFLKFQDTPQAAPMDFPTVDSLELTSEEKTKYQTLLLEFRANTEDSSKLFQIARFIHIGGNFQIAEELYLKVLEARPEDTLVMNNLADVYYTLGEFEKSEALYQSIIQVNPKWLSAYFELANIYRYKLPEKYPTLLPLIDTGLQIAPENAEDFYTLYALYYRDTKDKEKAIEYYKKVLEINPQNEGAKEEIKFLEK